MTDETKIVIDGVEYDLQEKSICSNGLWAALVPKRKQTGWVNELCTHTMYAILKDGVSPSSLEFREAEGWEPYYGDGKVVEE